MGQPHIHAGIELHGRVMRYVELDRGDGAHRLLRLGSCDFDFDVARALLDLSGPTYLDTIAMAIREIFDGSEAGQLRLAIHPPDCTAFFSPLPEGLPPADRFELLRQEAGMLGDISATQPIRIKATPLRHETLADGRRSVWHHVVHVPEAVHARLAHLSRQIDGAGYDLVDTTAAASSVVAFTREETAPEAFTLLLGLYDRHVEIALMREGAYYFGQHAPAEAPSDVVYFAMRLLEWLRVDPVAVGRIHHYGGELPAETAHVLQSVFGTAPLPLNPLRNLAQAAGTDDETALSAFTPCIGAVLA